MPYSHAPPQQYEQNMSSQGMAPFGVGPALGAPLAPPQHAPLSSSVPSTPREDAARFALPPEKPPPGYDHRLGKQMGHEYATHATTATAAAAHVNGHMQMTATQMSAPYVQGWQPADLSRPDANGLWDYKLYNHGGSQ